MRTWLRSTFKWETYLGLETNIPVTDWHIKKEKHFIKIHGMSAHSLPGRKGKMDLMILRVSVGPMADAPEVLKRLCSIASERKIEVASSYHEFSIVFDLKNGESFADAAISMATAIYNRFGVQIPRDDDKVLRRRLASFTITHELFYKYRNGWIRDESFHRIHHKLIDEKEELEIAKETKS